MTISIIAAIGTNRAIGKANKLLWEIPADLARFKELTGAHPLVMGRKTFESILARNGKPLPGRAHIVLTRDPSRKFEGKLVYTARDVPHALRMALVAGHHIWIIGGEAVFKETLPVADTLYLTEVNDAPGADAFFPEFTGRFRELRRDPNVGTHNGLAYQYVTYKQDKVVIETHKLGGILPE